MKKSVKKSAIFIIVLLLVVFLYSVVDFFASLNCGETSWIYYINDENKVITYFKSYGELHNYSLSSLKYLNNADSNILSDNYSEHGNVQDFRFFRPIENKSANNSIIVFGGVRAYGMFLNENETISANLGKLLPNYKVCNRAKPGWTTSSMLYQLEHKTFSEIENVKYVVYVFEPSHFYLNENALSILPVPYYKLDRNNKLHFQKFTLKNISGPLFLKMKNDYYSKSLALENCYIKTRLTKTIIEIAKRFSEYRFPGSKFVVLRCDDGNKEAYNVMFEELKNEDIIVLSSKDLLKSNVSNLPLNTKIWNKLTVEFVKYLQEKGSFNE